MTTGEEDFVDVSYAALTHFVKLGSENYGDSLVFRAENADGLLQDIKEAAELSKELQDAGATLKQAFVVVKKKVEEQTSSRARQARPSSSRSTRTQSQRPGSQTKRNDPPMIDELCDCGEPYKDLNGMTYAKGSKAGQLYPNRYYASCDNRDCKPWGEQE